MAKSKNDSKKSDKKKEKLFLIDGNGLAYRAFYAVVPMWLEKLPHFPGMTATIRGLKRVFNTSPTIVLDVLSVN